MVDVKIRARPAPSYDGDYYAWSQDQGARLRAAKPKDIDWENLAEEIESLGRSDKRAIESDLAVVMVHLLKWAYQPQKRKAGWKASTIEHRIRIRKFLAESPSLRSYPAKVLAEQYDIARLKAAAETRLAQRTFPETCPFTIEQILDLTWYPEAPRG
jgi:hypothetical protein